MRLCLVSDARSSLFSFLAAHPRHDLGPTQPFSGYSWLFHVNLARKKSAITLLMSLPKPGTLEWY